MGTPDYLPTQAVAVGCTRAHGLVTGDYTVTIRWQAQRQRARLPSEEMLTTEPACAVTPTHAPQRSTAQHSTAQRCSSVTTAPLRQLHCRPPSVAVRWHNIRPVQHRIASHGQRGAMRAGSPPHNRASRRAQTCCQSSGALSLPHADACGVHSREASGRDGGWFRLQ